MTENEKSITMQVIETSLRNKFEDYNPANATVLPFHTRLLGKDRMALFSFIQSLNTTFGSVIYEPVAETLAKPNFSNVARGKASSGFISSGAEQVINQIRTQLESSDIQPNQKEEVAKIREVCRTGSKVKIRLRKADIYLIDTNNCHYPIEIKTAKPNIDGFEKYKETMLRWVASILFEDPEADVAGMIGIPYNPDAPEPYKHWTIQGMIEKGKQIRVGDEFWDFLAGKPVYDDLLTCFETVGKKMRPEIDKFFDKFKQK